MSWRLISTPISKRIPKSIHDYLERNKNSQVELHFHKNTPLFTEVLPSSFTKGEHEDFKSPPFHNYLKFTFGYEFLPITVVEKKESVKK